MPRLDNYYSDWHQLEIVLVKTCYRGVYVFDEDAHGGVHSQVFAVNVHTLKHRPEKNWDGFVKEFSDVWLHEWLHLVGLTDEGIKRAKKLGFPVA